jgi:hypothetical protein
MTPTIPRKTPTLECNGSEMQWVSLDQVPFKRYVGAQIGIYNPQGAKVGAVSHLRNKEFLYVVTRS